MIFHLYKKNKIITSTVLFQIFVIVFLSFLIYKAHQIKISVISIDENDLIFNKTSGLKYFYEFSPNIILKKKPGWLKKEVKYNINSDSLNERYDYPVEKPVDVFRILTLGDSFTFGEYVNTSENYPEQLEDKLNTEIKCNNISKFEVINLGVGGYDIKYAVERFRLRGKKYDPDVIIWLLPSGNIAFNRLNEARIPFLRRIFEENKTTQNNESQKEKGYKTSIKLNKYISDFIGEKNINNYQISALREFIQFFQKSLIFVSFKSVDQKKKDIVKTAMNDRKNTYYLNNLILKKEDYLPDGHPNAKGHKRIAADIFNYLLEYKNILPCNE